MAERRICVVTGSRAEYGLLYWLMRYLQKSPDAALQLVTTGMHLSPRFGETWKTIAADGFEIAARVDMLEDGDSVTDIIRSMARGMVGIADALARLQPEIVVVLGDRFEIFAAAQAALLTGIPIAHIHGGEVTEGAFDDALRHAITKMANLHFTTTEPYRRRVIQMGENSEHVFTVGAPGVENIVRLTLLDRDALSDSVGFDLTGPYFLVTYHPETRGDANPERGAQALLKALSRFPNRRVVFTGVNADPGYSAIDRAIRDYAAVNTGRVLKVESLGQLRYLSAMNHCDAVIGNSSSGIIEAPAMAIPTVNIGARQDGRIRAPSVIDCAEESEAIAAAIERAIAPGFRDGLAGMETPYGQGDTATRIGKVLTTMPLDTLSRKRFHDLPMMNVA